jgi:hypothetical protein
MNELTQRWRILDTAIPTGERSLRTSIYLGMLTMSERLSIHLSIYPPTHLSTYLPACLSIYLRGSLLPVNARYTSYPVVIQLRFLFLLLLFFHIFNKYEDLPIYLSTDTIPVMRNGAIGHHTPRPHADFYNLPYINTYIRCC